MPMQHQYSGADVTPGGYSLSVPKFVYQQTATCILFPQVPCHLDRPFRITKMDDTIQALYHFIIDIPSTAILHDAVNVGSITVNHALLIG